MLSSDRNCLRKGSLMSRPRVTPEVARRARPGEARSRDCCRIIGVGVPRTEGWDPGSRGGALGAWSRRKGCGFTHAAVGFCVDSEEELRATARRVYLVERGVGGNPALQPLPLLTIWGLCDALLGSRGAWRRETTVFAGSAGKI